MEPCFGTNQMGLQECHESLPRTPRDDNTLNECVGCLRIALDRKTKESNELRALSYIDDLTGLANRRFLIERFGELVESSSAFGAIFFDIKNFKSVNESHGHDVGDQIIQYTGHLLDENTKSTEMVARIGGDEFVLLAPVSTPENLKKIADRLENVYAKSEPVSNMNILRHESDFVGLHIGYAFYEDGMTYEQLCALADPKGRQEQDLAKMIRPRDPIAILQRLGSQASKLLGNIATATIGTVEDRLGQ